MNSSFLALLFAALLLLFAVTPSAMASEVPLPEEGIIVEASLQKVSGLYTRPLGVFQSFAGLRFQPRPGGLSLPLGVTRSWFSSSGGRYEISGRAELAPLLLLRDDLDVALDATLGVDQFFHGTHLSGLLGLEMDLATALTSLPDRRHRYLLVGGLGRQFEAFGLWLTGRVGYMAGGVGGGAAYTDLGLVVTIPLFSRATE